MEWKDLNWALLRELRGRFLHPAAGDYWKSETELAHYDTAFAPRIAAKWEAVVREVAEALKSQGPLHFLDWGCGTGVATRVLFDHLGTQVERVSLWDRSALARRFAQKKWDGTAVVVENLSAPEQVEGPHWVVASHVWNELEGEDQEKFLGTLGEASGFLWVEPGTPDLARAVVQARERLGENFDFIAPCPHQKECGMIAPQNAGHWCHFFAEPAPHFFQSADWARFSKELQIDLRSLPVSYLVGVRKSSERAHTAPRVIGRPRVSKGFTKVLVCEAEGVSEKVLRPGKKQKKEFQQVIFSRKLEK
jgi:ribosomal protein RSM22 (predicted rRNA methylase)